MGHKDNKSPEATKGDLAHALAKGAISEVPYLGGLAAELFEYYIKPPLQKRTAEWLTKLAERVKKLEETGGVSAESLANNPLFITAVAQAVSIAIRNHQKEKLEALQNAVINTASGIRLDENIQLLFLSLVDYMTALHLKVLLYFDDPAAWFEAHGQRAPSIMGAAVNGLEEAMPELRDRRDIYDTIIDDLSSRGLLNTDRTGMHALATTVLGSRTSQLGKDFIRYISSQ